MAPLTHWDLNLIKKHPTSQVEPVDLDISISISQLSFILYNLEI